MITCACASPDCQANGCAQVRRLRQVTPGFQFTTPIVGRVKAIEYHPNGTVKRVEYDR